VTTVADYAAALTPGQREQFERVYLIYFAKAIVSHRLEIIEGR
jgi:hypothetical protein